jgi:hypothetical protein
LPEALFKLGQNLARWPFLIARIMIVAIQATHLDRLPVRPARSFRGRLLDKIGDTWFFKGPETAKPKPRTQAPRRVATTQRPWSARQSKQL